MVTGLIRSKKKEEERQGSWRLLHVDMLERLRRRGGAKFGLAALLEEIREEGLAEGEGTARHWWGRRAYRVLLRRYAPGSAQRASAAKGTRGFRVPRS